MTEPDDKDIAAMAAAVDEALSDRWDASAGGDPDALWGVYTGLGIADLIGDLGQPVYALAAVLRVAGRHLAPGPLVEEAFARPWLAAQLGPGVLDPTGSRDRLALVDPAATRQWRAARGEVRLDRGRLNGSISGVAHARASSTLVVLAEDGATERLAVIGSGAEGVQITATDGLDPGCPIGTIEFHDCRAELTGAGTGTIAALRAWLRVLTAAELCGIAEAVVEMTRQYAIRREQFGRPIAGFQAVRHTLADMATHSIALSNLVERTARELDELDDVSRRIEASAIAKAHAAEVALRICEQGLQLHGGIGFVEEHRLHRYFKATLRRYAHYGTPGELHAEIGAMLALPG